MTNVVVHFLVFSVVSVAALLAPLVLGYFVRPKLPTPEKDAAYECGEPTIGSSYIQFDLRFYVVALLFIIFDVEVVFFFPWVLVFGSAMQLADQRVGHVTVAQVSADSPAAKSGLEVDDVILSVNETEISDPRTLQQSITKLDISKPTEIHIIRDGTEKDLTVTLEKLPTDFGVALTSGSWDRVDLSERLLGIKAGTRSPESVITARQALAIGWTGFFDLLVFFVVLLVGFAYVWKRGDLDWVRAVTEKARQSHPPRVTTDEAVTRVAV